MQVVELDLGLDLRRRTTALVWVVVASRLVHTEPLFFLFIHIQ